MSTHHAECHDVIVPTISGLTKCVDTGDISCACARPSNCLTLKTPLYGFSTSTAAWWLLRAGSALPYQYYSPSLRVTTTIHISSWRESAPRPRSPRRCRPAAVREWCRSGAPGRPAKI
eukprot:scaffold34482_cov40-Phaeocystis_antarctica.AAC.2